jgi:murein L,D-transpeptidase YcbB/YkuD
MDLMAILSLISVVTGVIQTAKSNEDIATKITNIAGPLVPVLTSLAKQYFPGVPNPVAVGATMLDVVTVKHIQSALNSKNQAGVVLDVDGLYGAATKDAVKAFQTANKLTVDGWAGKNTQKLLFA